jgi:hypothetical protein
MAAISKTIHVTETTNLGELLDDVEREPVTLERDGVRFRLNRDDRDIAYEPDPEAVRAMLAAVAGSWADVDVDEMIRDIYEARVAGSRPLDRP